MENIFPSDPGGGDQEKSLEGMVGGWSDHRFWDFFLRRKYFFHGIFYYFLLFFVSFLKKK